MQITQTTLPEVLLFEPKAFSDERGFFLESFNRRAFREATGLELEFVQDNHSHSIRNVLRGLHFQIQQPQGKLVRAVVGEIFDVAVDLRRSSPSFGKWAGFVLSAANRRMAWIPPGFAHGFCVCSEGADVLYKTTDYWAPQHERTLIWDDPLVGVDWPLTQAPIVAAKDRAGLRLADLDVYA